MVCYERLWTNDDLMLNLLLVSLQLKLLQNVCYPYSLGFGEGWHLNSQEPQTTQNGCTQTVAPHFLKNLACVSQTV